MDIISIFTVSMVVFVEISVLVYLYKNYITTWNAAKWEEKAREEGWLRTLLDDIIMEVAEMVSTSVIETLKMEYTQAQGVLTRVSKSGDATPEQMGLEVAENILKSMGWKNPNVLMVARLASTLGGLVKGNDSAKAEPLPIGRDLFRG
jgi:hypothetical protein|tara:strand:- start:354 stop:797 length:444 start_codon:yes stop_codon:yes gene_type:complete